MTLGVGVRLVGRGYICHKVKYIIVCFSFHHMYHVIFSPNEKLLIKEPFDHSRIIFMSLTFSSLCLGAIIESMLFFPSQITYKHCSVVIKI